MMLCNYLGCIFTLLEFNKFYIFTRNLYFIPPIILFGLYFFLKNYLKGMRTERRPLVKEGEKNKEEKKEWKY